MKSNKRLIAFAIAIMAISCTSNSTSDLTEPQLIENVTYTQHIKPIIDNNCIHCHKTPPENGAPMSLATYDLVKSAIQTRPLIAKISKAEGEEGLMPLGGPRLPQSKINLIIKWQQQGLQE